MKKIILLTALLASTQAMAIDRTEIILSQVYGSFSTACTQDADADTAQHNRLGPLTADRRYVVYCHDGAGAGVACECLQGTSSVDASAAVGFTMFAGEKTLIRANPGYLYISCVPFVDDQKYDVCPLD